MSRPRLLTQTQEDHVRELAKRWPIPHIARRLGISRSTAHRALRPERRFREKLKRELANG